MPSSARRTWPRFRRQTCGRLASAGTRGAGGHRHCRRAHERQHRGRVSAKDERCRNCSPPLEAPRNRQMVGRTGSSEGRGPNEFSEKQGLSLKERPGGQRPISFTIGHSTKPVSELVAALNRCLDCQWNPGDTHTGKRHRQGTRPYRMGEGGRWQDNLSVKSSDLSLTGLQVEKSTMNA
jgi:hypothetical protein